MTINTRNKTILSGLGLAVLLFCGFLVSVILILKQTSAEINLLITLASLALELVFAIAAILILYFSFNKTKSPEIFFFIIFLLSMSFNSLKASFVLVNILDFAPYYSGLLTRAVYFGRFFGTLAVLVSGLFCLGAEYQRIEIYLGVTFLLAFTLSAAITIDLTETEAHLLYRMGNNTELLIISALFLCFGVFNYILYAVQNSSKDHVLMAVGLALVIGGREVIFFSRNLIALIVAYIMLIGGAMLFGGRNRAVHLWS